MGEAARAITLKNFKGRAGVALLGWALLIALGAFSYRVWPSGAAATPAVAPRGWSALDVVSSITTGLGITLAIFGLTWFRLRDRAQVKNPSLNRWFTLVVDETGISLSDPIERGDRNWGAFIGFQETRNLWLLYFG